MASIFNPNSPTAWSICNVPPFHVSNQTTSPVQFNGTLTGSWKSTHTSNVAILYKNTTLPTPWPILLPGFLISLITSSLPLFSEWKRDTSPNYEGRLSPFKLAISNIMAAIQSMRSIVALISTFRVTAGSGGRLIADSAVLGLWMSTMTCIVDGQVIALLRYVAIGATVCNSMTLAITFLSPFLRLKDGDYYAKLFLVGGSCAKMIGDVTVLKSCPEQYYVGCGVDQLAQKDIASYADNSAYTPGYFKALDVNTLWMHHANISHMEGYIRSAAMSMLGTVLFGLVVLPFMGLYPEPRKVIRFLSKPWKMDYDPLSETAQDSRINKLGASLISTPIIATFFTASIVVHIMVETSSASAVVQDSSGNVTAALLGYGNQSFDMSKPLWQTWTGDGVNGSAWTDFFLVQTPADRYGFLDYWWGVHGAPAWNWLSLT